VRRQRFRPVLLTDWKQRRAVTEAKPLRGRIPKGLIPRQLMERKLATKRGGDLYRNRGCTVEPVFGRHRERGLDHFSRSAPAREPAGRSPKSQSPALL
jgi:hypothetical protein